jgi:hypothetical protein
MKADVELGARRPPQERLRLRLRDEPPAGSGLPSETARAALAIPLREAEALPILAVAPARSGAARERALRVLSPSAEGPWLAALEGAGAAAAPTAERRDALADAAPAILLAREDEPLALGDALTFSALTAADEAALTRGNGSAAAAGAGALADPDVRVEALLTVSHAATLPTQRLIIEGTG